MVICIGNDGLDDVFRCVTFWGRCGSCDGDICADGIVGAAVVGGGVWVERYMIIGKSLAVVLCVHFLLSLSQQKAWLPKTPLWTWYPHMQHVFGGYIGRRSLRWMQMRTLLISSANAPSLQALSFRTLCSLPPTPHLGPHILVRWRLNQSGG